MPVNPLNKSTSLLICMSAIQMGVFMLQRAPNKNLNYCLKKKKVVKQQQ